MTVKGKGAEATSEANTLPARIPGATGRQDGTWAEPWRREAGKRRAMGTMVFRADGQAWRKGMKLECTGYRPRTGKRSVWWEGRGIKGNQCGSLGGRGVGERMDTCIRLAESLCYPPELSQHCLSTILSYKIKSFKRHISLFFYS